MRWSDKCMLELTHHNLFEMMNTAAVSVIFWNAIPKRLFLPKACANACICPPGTMSISPSCLTF